MANQIINIGAGPNSGDGDTLRIAFDKVNDNFVELYARDENTDGQTLTLVDNVLSISDGNSVDLSAYLDDTQFSGDYDDLTNKPDLSAYLTSLDGDLTGNVLAEDTTILVDAVNGKIIGPVETNSVTAVSGNLSLAADNYVIIDSNNNGQINIGQASGIGNILLGNKSNGTNVSVNGDIIMAEGTTISGYINIEDLQTLVSASTDFEDFQTRIASL